jgi:hypothetical protein
MPFHPTRRTFSRAPFFSQSLSPAIGVWVCGTLAGLLIDVQRADAAPPTGSGWQVVFSDEIEGDSLDLQKWRHHATGLRRQAYNTPGTVKVSGGNLSISTFTNGATHYTGMVSTAQTFL